VLWNNQQAHFNFREMGCVPSKGEVSAAPAKTEYQHALPNNDGAEKKGPDSARPLIPQSATTTDQPPTGPDGSAATANGKKRTSLDKSKLDAPGALTVTSISTDLNKTEITDAGQLEVLAPTALLAQLQNQTDPDVDLTPPLAPDELPVAPAEVEEAITVEKGTLENA
jgi:hypothetical protein